MVEPKERTVEKYIKSIDGKYEIYHHMWRVKDFKYLHFNFCYRNVKILG